MSDLDRHQGTQVARGIRVRVELARETASGRVGKVIEQLLLLTELGVTGDPDLVLVRLASNVLLQVLGHVLGQVLLVVVEVGHPVEDAVQLQENTRRLVQVAVLVVLAARSELGVVEETDLAGWGIRSRVANNLVGTASSQQAAVVVSYG